MANESTLYCEKGNKELIIHIDIKAGNLRKAIWRAIHANNDSLSEPLSDSDIAFVLGIVQYELIHHHKGE